MKKGIKGLLVLLTLRLMVHQSWAVDISKGLQLLEFAWSTFDTLNTAHDTYSKFDSPSIDDALEKTEEIIQSLEDQGAHIELKIQQSMDLLLTRLPLLGEIAGDVNLLNKYIVRIDELYADLLDFLSSPHRFGQRAIEYLIKTFRSRDGDDVQATIHNMFNLIIPQRLGKMKKGLFVLLAEETRSYGLEVCDTGAPPQQRLVELFNIAIESEMRSYAMNCYGLYIEGYLDKENYTLDIKRAQVKFEKRGKAYLEALKNTLSGGSRFFRRCDPPEGHKRDVTFYEFRKFLQSFVVQESVFTESNNCWDKCSGYAQPTPLHYGCDGYNCDRGLLTCAGRITNCEVLANYEKPDAAVCELGPREPRRYQWFVNHDGDTFGEFRKGCPGEIKYISKIATCDLCRCICVEDDTYLSSSSRFISLREQLTNVEDNMVAIGLAFVIAKDVLHVRVMQGKFGPRADIVKNSTSWVEPEDIYFDLMKTFNAQAVQFVKKSEGGEDEDMILDKDIAELTLERRRINLDAMSVPRDHAVTGVRFRRINESPKGNIQLEIHATPFDGKTGQLNPGSSFWITPDDMPYAQKYLQKVRKEYIGMDTKSPIKSRNSELDTKPFMFIDISWSSFKYDAAQTTIPLLDGLPVVSDPPTALVGVGLYHKAEPGYGGFLTFVLEGLNQAPYL